MREKEAKLLDIQNIASIIFIGTIVLSIVLTYNEKQQILNQPKLFNNKDSQYLSLLIRIIILGVALTFVYINIEQYKIGKYKKQNVTPLKQEVVASSLNTISALIVLYIIFETWNENLVADYENPTL